MMSQIMFFQELVPSTRIVRDGVEGCFGGKKHHRSGFCFDLRPVFQWPQVQPHSQERHNRRPSIRNGLRRKPFLGGSDPTLSGLTAAQRLRRRGRYRPSCPTEFLAPSPGELQAEDLTILYHE